MRGYRKLLARALGALSLLVAAVPAAASDVAPSGRVRSSVVVRSAPTTSSAPVGRLSPGESAPLVGDAPGWHRVRLADGTEGWVSKAWTVVEDGPAAALAPSGPFRMHAIDVGTGLAVFVEGPGFALLYDAGSQDDLATGADNRVVAYIRRVRPDLRVIDQLVLSHPHKDHVELMPDVFDRFEVRHVWDSGALNRTRGYCRFLRAVAAEPGATYHDAAAEGGTREATFSNGGCSGTIRIPRGAMITAAPVPLGPGASMTFLHRDATRHSDPNENTLVVRLDIGGRRVMLAGDAEGGGRLPPEQPPSDRSVEAELLACCRADLAADVLVVGHHGSLTSSRRAFLDAVGARTYVISSGPHPYSRVVLPDAAVVAELASRGRVLRTDEGDEACGLAERKVGPNADESPGGCSSVVVTVEGGAVTAGAGARDD